MNNDERPKMSLRLRSPTDNSAPCPEAAGTPPAATATENPSQPPPAAELPQGIPNLSLRKPRLGNLMSGGPDTAPVAAPPPATPPATKPPPPPPPVQAAALQPPPAAQDAATTNPPPLPASPVPAKATSEEPPPLPPTAFLVAQSALPQPAKTATPPPPVAKQPPPPIKQVPLPAPQAAAAPAASPAVAESAQKVGMIVILVLVLAVVGGGAYLVIANPLHLFGGKKTASKPQPAAVATAPIQQEPKPAAVPPLAKPEPVPAPEPKFQTIAEEPLPPPTQNPDVVDAIVSLKISTARADAQGGMMMIGTKVFRPGATINAELGIEFTGFTDGTLKFRDPSGAIYERRF